MPFADDLKQLRHVVCALDPSYASVPDHTLKAGLDAVERAAQSGKHAFLLEAMRLTALSGNGHSRVLPHAAIQTMPLRMIAIGHDIALNDGARVVSINGQAIEDICARARPFLSGTAARQRALTPLLLAWPEALRMLTDYNEDHAVFEVDGPDQDRRHISLPMADVTPALNTYPIFETGQLRLNARPPWTCARHDNVLHIGLHDLKTMTPTDGDTILAHILGTPRSPLIIDLRGNPGGNFFNAMGLINAVKAQWRGNKCAVLVDKFTFSAAIVCAALFVHHLGNRCSVMGETMGDALEFHAEGDTLILSDSGASLRYSTQRHDWHTGRVDPSLSADIAAVQVGVGPLSILPLPFSAAALAQGQDLALTAALSTLDA